MTNVSLVSHILLLFQLPKKLVEQIAKYEELEKHLLSCTQHRAKTSTYLFSHIRFAQ